MYRITEDPSSGSLVQCLAKNYKNYSIVSVDMDKVGVNTDTIRTVNTTCTAALKTTTHPKTRCRKPYTATQHLMILMTGVCTRNMSS